MFNKVLFTKWIKLFNKVFFTKWRLGIEEKSYEKIYWNLKYRFWGNLDERKNIFKENLDGKKFKKY